MIPKKIKKPIGIPKSDNVFIMEEDLRVPHQGTQKLHLNYSHPKFKKVNPKILEFAMSLVDSAGIGAEGIIDFATKYKGKTPKRALLDYAIAQKQPSLNEQIDRENQITQNRNKYFKGK